MSEVLRRKKIVITSTCSLRQYGGTFGPIRAPFYETLSNIAGLLGDGIEVYEVLPNGEKIKLSLANYDADNTTQATRKEVEQKAVETKKTAQPVQQKPQVAKEEQKNEVVKEEVKPQQTQEQQSYSKKNKGEKPVADSVVQE